MQLGDNCLRTTDKKVDNPENRLGLTSRFKSLLAVRCGCMALKAEEKSTKRIRTNEPVFCLFVFQDEYICLVQKSECCVFGASVVLVRKLV